MTLRGLYAITPDLADTELLARKVDQVLGAGAALLQYRNKTLPKEKRFAQAQRLAALARGYGVPLIVNDDLDVALSAGAAGVHIGREDGDPAAARAKLPGRILGVSCYDQPELARAAVRAGTDYVAFGSVFPSTTKPGAVRASLSLFATDLGVPLCAIGGVTLDNAPRLIEAGASLLAVISDLFDAPDIAQRATEYRKLFG
jgi:thiamine-phosphate pyrophosphorylase